jgi:hypothetical protein
MAPTLGKKKKSDISRASKVEELAIFTAIAAFPPQF